MVRFVSFFHDFYEVCPIWVLHWRVVLHDQNMPLFQVRIIVGCVGKSTIVHSSRPRILWRISIIDPFMHLLAHLHSNSVSHIFRKSVIYCVVKS